MSIKYAGAKGSHAVDVSLRNKRLLRALLTDIGG